MFRLLGKLLYERLIYAVRMSALVINMKRQCIMQLRVRKSTLAIVNKCSDMSAI